MDYKQKYIELQKAVSALKRGKPSDEVMNVLYGWNAIDFATAYEYMVDAAFDRKDRERFIKRLNKEGVDLYRLAWLKSERDAVRAVLNGLDYSHPYHNWFVACETVLDGFLNDAFITLTVVPNTKIKKPIIIRALSKLKLTK